MKNDDQHFEIRESFLRLKKIFGPRRNHLIISTNTPINPLTISNMIQRALLRHSRAGKFSLQCISRTSLPCTSRTQLLASRFAFTQPQLQRRLPSRCYSATTEATKPSDGEVSAPSEEGLAESKEKDLDPVQKELEAKNREIIDLKVRFHNLLHQPLISFLPSLSSSYSYYLQDGFY